MTRNQIKTLMADRQPQPAAPRPHAVNQSAQRPAQTEAKPVGEQPPVLPSSVEQVFLPARSPLAGDQLLYEPRLIAMAKVHFVDSRKGLAADEELTLIAEVTNSIMGVDWDDAIKVDLSPAELHRDHLEPAQFDELPENISDKKQLREWEKSLDDHLYRSRRYELLKSENLNEYSMPGEHERDFRIRLAERAREERDLQTEKLRRKYASKVRTLEERVRKAEQAVEREQKEAKDAKLQTAISFGATILSAVFGRKSFGRATTTARGYGRMSKQTGDVDRAYENLETYQEQLDELEAEISAETDAIADKYNPLTEIFETIELKPRRTDIDIRMLAVAWLPCRVDANHRVESLF